MTVVEVESKVENSLPQEKVDTISSQEKVDTNLPQASQENKAPEKPEDPNWRAFREARKKDRAEKEAAERRAAEKEAEATALKAAMEAAFSKGNNQSASQNVYPNNYSDQEESEEQRIERKVQEAISKREEKYRQEAAQREMQELPSRLQQQFPDYNHIVTTENLDYLEYHHPELAASLKMNPEGFNKWALIYNATKKYVPNATNARKDAARADINHMKPKSMSSTGMSQNIDVKGNGRLSDEQKAANWARMQQTLKGVN